MKDSITSRIKNAWSVFKGDKYVNPYQNYGVGYPRRPDRPVFIRGTSRSLMNAIFNRIAIDVASLNFNCVQLDENKRYKEIVDNGLNECLTVSANRDQTGRALLQDIVISLLDEGCVAVVPVDTDINPNSTNSYNILTLRTAKILEWYPEYVRVQLFNEDKNLKEDITLPKRTVAIIENPLYSVINEDNSVFQQLVRKLNLLDVVDNQSCSGKMDLIVQLPYVVKTPTRQAQADQRRHQIEEQLTESKYGIAYIDGTEKVTQLNRSVENNLLKSIEYLTNLAYSQIGITAEILNGTADEKTMLNYNNRVIEPIASAITNEFIRKFLTKTARTQGKTVMFFRDPFKLVPLDNIAEIADKFTRNEIMTSNEIRQAIGMPPANDPKADQLINSNISQPEETIDYETDANQDENRYADDGYD